MSSSLQVVSEWKLEEVTGVGIAQASRCLAFAGPSTITFWQQVETQWACVSTLEIPMSFSLFVLSPDGRKCAVVVQELDGEQIHVYLTRSATLTAKFPVVRGHTTSLTWSPQGDVVSGSSDGWIYVWDFAKAFEPFAFQLAYKAHLQAAEGKSIEILAWSPDGTYLATCEQDDPLVRVRNVNSDVQVALASLRGRFLSIQALAWSPESLRFALSRGPRLEIWTRRPRKTPVANFESPGGQALTTLSWLSFGSHLLASNLHGDVCLWEVVTGHLTRWDVGACVSVALSSDGLLLMGRQNGLVHLYAPFEVKQEPA